MSKFSDVYAEAAHRVSLDGCGSYAGSVEEMGHFSYVSFAATTLATWGDHDLILRYGKEVEKGYGEGNLDLILFIIIKENDQGFVDTVLVTASEGAADSMWSDVERAYDKYYEDQPV